jgi:hypothetical protein
VSDKSIGNAICFVRINFTSLKEFHGSLISLINWKKCYRTISCNYSQYGMSKESSYKSRSIQKGFCLSFFFFCFIDSRRALLYRGASALLIEYQVKGPEKRKIRGCYSRLASLLRRSAP